MKHRRRGKIIFLTVAGIFLAVLAAFWWLLTLGFDESRYFRRYSLEYWLLVPDSIHRLPMDYCGSPEYHSSAGDGPKPSSFTRYCHTSDLSAALAHYQELFLEWGYRDPDREIVAYDWKYFYFHQDDHVLELSTRAPGRFAITYVE